MMRLVQRSATIVRLAICLRTASAAVHQPVSHVTSPFTPSLPVCRPKPRVSSRSFGGSRSFATIDYDHSVDKATLERMIKERRVQVIDVRRPEEYKDGAIPTSVNIPLSDLEWAFALPEAKFREKFGIPMPNEDTDNIVLHCLAGIRSSKALALLHDKGLTKVKHFPGGYEEWIQKP